jgi:O-antigen ligase
MKPKILRFLDKGVEYSIYVMIFFIPISIAAIGSFAGMAAFLFLIKKIISLDFKSLKSNGVFFILLFIFFVLMVLSLFNSGIFLEKSLRALCIKWGRFPFFLWAIIDTFQDKKRIIRAVYVFLLSATIVGLSVFTQKFMGFEFLRGRVLSSPSLPSTGPFKNQNGLAAYLTCLIPIALSFSLWKWKKILVKLPLIIITVILSLALIWTFCRGGWLGTIAGLIFVMLFTNYYQLKKLFWVLFSFSYIVCIPLVGFGLFYYRNRGDANRFPIFHGAWRMIKENPFLGKGLGTFMDYCVKYAESLSGYYVHNCFLQIWAESGIFSLLAFLLFVGYVFYRSIKVIIKIPKSLGSFILIGLTGGLMSLLVHSFFEVHLYSFQLSFLFWIILGLTFALSSAFEKEQDC